MENTKRWSKIFLWIGRISIIIFLLVGFRTIQGFRYPDQEGLQLYLAKVRTITLILGITFLMIGNAIKSIYTDVLDMLYKKENNLKY